MPTRLALPSLPALLLASLFLTTPLQAQVTVTKFSKDFPGAYAFTFDDALPSQIIYAAPYLDQVGLKGSFYLITNNVIDGAAGNAAIGKPTTWADWKAISDKGHEIGSHTLTHTDLTTLAADALGRELTESAKIIKEKIGITPVTLAYPYNAFNATVGKAMLQTYIAARTSQVAYGDVAGFANTTVAMNKYVDGAVAGKSFQIGMIHGLTEPYAPMDPAQFLEHLKYCKTLMDDGKLWVATFGEIRKYLIEKDSIHITIKTQTVTEASFTAEASLDSVRFNVPLTFAVAYTGTGAAPAGAKAYRAGSATPLPVTVEADRILVQAVPGKALISVDWSGTAAIHETAAANRGAVGAKTSKRKYLVSGKRLLPQIKKSP